MQLSAKLESLPTRFSAHPSGLNASPAWAPGVLAWLPVQWVAPLRFHDRAHIAPRHVAAVSLAAAAQPGAALAHTAPASLLDPEETPVLVCQWGTDDVDLLGLSKVDLSATTALPDAASGARPTIPSKTSPSCWPCGVPVPTAGKSRNRRTSPSATAGRRQKPSIRS